MRNIYRADERDEREKLGRKPVMVAVHSRRGHEAVERSRLFECGQLGTRKANSSNRDMTKTGNGRGKKSVAQQNVAGDDSDKWCSLHKTKPRSDAESFKQRKYTGTAQANTAVADSATRYIDNENNNDVGGAHNFAKGFLFTVKMENFTKPSSVNKPDVGISQIIPDRLTPSMRQEVRISEVGNSL